MRIDGRTLCEWRRSRGWDVPALARELRKTAEDEPPAAHHALVRMIRRWEREGLSSERYELLYRSLGFPNIPGISPAVGSPPPSLSRQPAPSPDPGSVGPEHDGRLDYTLGHPADTDLVTVARLRQQIQRLDEQYVHVPSSALLADAGQHLGQARFLAAHAVSSRIRRELLVTEAEAAILMGQLVWDASQRRDHESAHSYLDQAVSAARKIRAPAAEGLALLRKSMIALYGEHNPRTGLELSVSAAQTAAPASEVVTGLALLHQAEAHALLGDLPACESALSAAETQFGRVDDMDPAASLHSETQLGRMAGSCYLSLGDPDRAQQLLEATARALDDGSKAVPIVLANLALALIQKRDLDEAAARLHQAMDVIERNWSGGGLVVVFEAGQQLRPWRDVPAAQDARDRMLTLIAS